MPYPYLEVEGIHAGQLPQTPDVFNKIIKDYDLIIENSLQALIKIRNMLN